MRTSIYALTFVFICFAVYVRAEQFAHLEDLISRYDPYTGAMKDPVHLRFTTTENKFVGIVIPKQANIRSGPGVSYEIVGAVPQFKKVRVYGNVLFEESGPEAKYKWYKVGNNRFIMQHYLYNTNDPTMFEEKTTLKTDVQDSKHPFEDREFNDLNAVLMNREGLPKADSQTPLIPDSPSLSTPTPPPSGEPTIASNAEFDEIKSTDVAKTGEATQPGNDGNPEQGNPNQLIDGNNSETNPELNNGVNPELNNEENKDGNNGENKDMNNEENKDGNNEMNKDGNNEENKDMNNGENKDMNNEENKDGNNEENKDGNNEVNKEENTIPNENQDPNKPAEGGQDPADLANGGDWFGETDPEPDD